MSSWRKRLKQGSIGGLEFHCEQASGQGGRRLVIHEYPLQEEHYVEDMGPSAPSDRLVIFLVGDDYDLRRDEMIAKLYSEGPHTLIHPHLGTLRVHVDDFNWVLSTKEGGFVRFNINYVLDGKRKYPQSTNANAQQLQNACNDCSSAVQTAFADQFSVDNKPAFVQDAALSQINTAINALNTLATVQDQAEALSSNLTGLMNQPAALAANLANFMAQVIGTDTNTTPLQNFNAVNTGIAAVDIVPLTTPSRLQQAQNQAATQQLLTGIATVETARTIANQTEPFSTYNEAINTRDVLLGQIDTLIESGTDDEYYAYVELQTALMKRVNEVAPGLQQVKHIQLKTTLPSHVLAHNLYGNAARADELVTRNSVKHPSFMPVGEDLEVLL